MFDQLFTCRRTVQRYVVAPMSEQRLRYLHHRADQGAARATLKKVAAYQLAVTRTMDLRPAGEVSPEEIHAAADRWVSRTPRHQARKDAAPVGADFTSTAIGWLRFLGRLHEPRRADAPGAALVAEYAHYMCAERGLAPLTVYTRRKSIEEFLGRFSADGRGMRDLTLVDLDDAIARKGMFSVNYFCRLASAIFAGSGRRGSRSITMMPVGRVGGACAVQSGVELPQCSCALPRRLHIAAVLVRADGDFPCRWRVRGPQAGLGCRTARNVHEICWRAIRRPCRLVVPRSPRSGELAAPQGDDGVGAGHGPHAGALEPGADGELASGLDDARRHAKTPRSELRIAHPVAVAGSRYTCGPPRRSRCGRAVGQDRIEPPGVQLVPPVLAPPGGQVRAGAVDGLGDNRCPLAW